MPRVNKNTTERYRVRALVTDVDGMHGLPVLKEWKAASFQHIQELHPTFAELPVWYFKNICRYEQPDGTWKARHGKPRVQRHIYVERLNFIQVPGVPRRPCSKSRHPRTPKKTPPSDETPCVCPAESEAT